jgi:ATP-dependent DNA helicase RecQ
VEETFEDRALAVLHATLGSSAEFRPGQLSAIEALVERGSRVLVVQRTGWGKSAVYFVATKLLREQRAGLTIIVSPLIALMRDQVDAAKRFGLNAVAIHTVNKDEWGSVDEELDKNKADLLLISPERFNNRDFRDRHLQRLATNTGLLVIDEAHCISDWGHDFRPDYRRLKNVLNLVPAARPVLCTTATANDRVIEDICEQLGSDLTVIRGTLDRETLSLNAVKIPSMFRRLAWLAEKIPNLNGSGIVYCLTVADTQRVADWLKLNGIAAAAYSGETETDERQRIEQKLKTNELKVVASTSALGMGFDKPDLSFVIHYQSPDSPVAYYQQVGRAGRAVEHADVILLWDKSDEEIWEYFLRTSLPDREHAEGVVAFLRNASRWVGRNEIETHVNTPSGRLTALLKVLEVEGAIEKEPKGAKYRSTLGNWVFDAERIDRVRQARLAEHQAMRDYAVTEDCRMVFLRRELDEQPDGTTADGKLRSCGSCDNCTGRRLKADTDIALVRKAQDFIRRRPITIEPRLRWTGHRAGRIERPLLPGRALCYLSDDGWGDEVREARRSSSPLSDDIVRAGANLIEKWLPKFDGSLVYVPSSDPNRSPVPDLASRLAALLGLSLSNCIFTTHANKPQNLMENGAQQLANVDGAFEILGKVPAGSVLLVDDIVDSRWTITVVGELLRSHGCARVYPFALAKVKG